MRIREAETLARFATQITRFKKRELYTLYTQLA